MPLWKKRLFSRLMKPADGAGGDLGGGAEPAPAPAQAGADTPAAEPAADPAPAADAPASDAPPSTSPESIPPETPAASKMAAFLDDLTDDPNVKKPADKPAATPGDASAKKDEPAAPPKPPEQEEAELLEGVKSERGKERIRQVFAERKQLEQDIKEFRDLVQSTGMSPQEFAQTLEFGRLAKSSDEKSLRVALEMIDGQRAMLYQRLGVEAPGVDLLAGHADLKTAVENMEITRDRAVELAKYRQQQAEATQRQQVQQQTQQERQVFQQQVSQAAGAMEAYLGTRATEIDHPARMKVITDHFKNPVNLQKFVTTYRPEQWAATIQMMYDNIQVPRASQPSAQPIRSRPATLGRPAASAATPIGRIAQRMDAMGI